MGIQNAYNGTRLFLFNGQENIPKEEFVDVELYRLRFAYTLCCIPFFWMSFMFLNFFLLLIWIILRLFVDKDQAKSENTASRISTQSKHSTRDEFLNKLQVKNIVELLDVDQVWLSSFTQHYKLYEIL